MICNFQFQSPGVIRDDPNVGPNDGTPVLCSLPQRDTAISQSKWALWDDLMSDNHGFTASVIPAQSPFGQGLAWNGQAENEYDSVVSRDGGAVPGGI